MTLKELIARSNATAPSKRRRASDPEHRLQCQCVRWFCYQHPKIALRLFAVPNGGQRSAATAARLKAEGVVPGVSDLILLCRRGPYGALCIEMKTTSRSSRQSELQRQWQRDISQDNDYLYVVCRTFDEFRSAVDGYLSLPRPSNTPPS